MSAGEFAIPAFSAVVATDEYDTIRPVVAALQRQTIAGRIELVIVIPASASGRLPRAELTGLGSFRIVEVDSVYDLARARAAGVRAAAAPIVFIGETHTYPEPGFAQALLTSFEQPWAAVVPAVVNANPESVMSWSSYLVDYEPWGERRRGGELPDPLIYNTAYRRSVLLSFGDQLGDALDPTSEMLWPRLHAEGHRACFAPEARLRHLNVARFGPMLVEKFGMGVVLGNHRADRWPGARRAAYVLASPLIPAVLIGRVVQKVGWPARPAAIPGALIGAVSKAAGEVLGYLGVRLPAVDAKRVDIEIHKVRYAARKHS